MDNYYWMLTRIPSKEQCVDDFKPQQEKNMKNEKKTMLKWERS